MRYAIILLYLLFFPYIVCSQNIILNHLSTNDGLLNNTVMMTEKDSDGFIWFATWYGLCRFDGENIISYDQQQDGAEAPPRKIQKIVDDGNGFIWVKTINHSLYLFDKKKERFKSVYDALIKHVSNTHIIKLQRAFDGSVLLLAKDKSLYLARVNEQGSAEIEQLFDAKNYSDASTYVLKQNVFFENAHYLGWVGVDYSINILPKGEALKQKPTDFIQNQMLLSPDETFTSSSVQGNLMWLGTSGGTFYSIHSVDGEVVRYEFAANKKAVTHILPASNKTLYLTVSQEGLYEYDLDIQEARKKEVDLVEERITHSLVDKYDKIWFYEDGEALVYYDPVNSTSRRFKLASSVKITSFRVEDAGEQGMLFLIPNGEILFFDREKLALQSVNQMKPIHDVAPNQSFFHMFLDNQGLVWFSSTTQGVYYGCYTKKQFFVHPLPGSQKKPAVRVCFQSRNGDIWVSTKSKEMYRFDARGQLVETYPSHENLFGAVYHMMEDTQGNLWLSTKGDGLLKLTPDLNAKYGYRFQRYQHNPADPTSLSGREVYYTYQDSLQRIWVCTFDGGLNLLHEEGDKGIFYHHRNGFNNYPSMGRALKVRSVAEDKNGRMWMATTDGLLSFDNRFQDLSELKFESYQSRVKAAYADNDISNLFKDSKGTLWVCLFGGSLHKLVGYDEERCIPNFESHSLSGSLKNELVLSIVEDNRGLLWLGTEVGMVSFDSNTDSFNTFSDYYGFPNSELEEGYGFCSSFGDIWVGGEHGYVTFTPNQLENVNLTCNTFIIDCSVGNQDIRSLGNPALVDTSIAYADEIELTHEQDMFSFEFIALSYGNRNNINYRYILEGYEHKWHFNGTNRLASYTNVPSGEYLFRVQAVNENDLDCISEKTLRVVVLPPWWATWWAYLIYALLGMALLCVGFRISLFFIRVKNNIYIDQRLSELKIRFFTNISHELRTPLTLIQGPIQELKNETLSEKGNQCIDLMEKNTIHMLNLVNQILDFRKIQNGKMRLHVSYFDLNEILYLFGKEFSLLAEEKLITFEILPTPDGIMIWGDKEKLCTVVRNLLSNAFKFTTAGGVIRISSGMTEDNRQAFVSVEDTGGGIPQNKLAEIFDRFVQADNSKESYYQGTGIGLALSKEIVELHHGSLIAGNGKKGALFTLQLKCGKEHFDENEVDFYIDSNGVVPVDRPQDLSDEDLENDENDSLPTVLVVDDNTDLCKMLKLQLEDKFKVYVANNGIEGLEKVNRYMPDVVVTDQMMPQMDGMEMLRNIRNDFQISHIPVILLTAKGDEESKIKAISQGANAYIVKPFNKDYLVVRIEQLLDERKRFRNQMWEDGDAYGKMTNASESYAKYLENRDLEFIEKIQQVVEENIENVDFTIDTMASSIGLSRSAFYKKLKGVTGLSPVDWVKGVRLRKSVELMKTTDMSVSEIAFAVGFSDSGYFSKCFRKMYNQTPREFMNDYRGK